MRGLSYMLLKLKSFFYPKKLKRLDTKNQLEIPSSPSFSSGFLEPETESKEKKTPLLQDKLFIALATIQGLIILYWILYFLGYLPMI